MEKQIMTVHELAEILRVHQSTVYRLCRQKQLPAFRIGSEWRFRSQDVLALLEAIAPRPIECALPPAPKRSGSREI